MMGKVVNIYIYKNLKGKILEIPAYIHSIRAPRMMLVLAAYDRDNNNYLMDIGKEPGMVYENKVWFKKKAFIQAKNVFLSDIAQKLSKLDLEEKDLRFQLGAISDQEKED